VKAPLLTLVAVTWTRMATFQFATGLFAYDVAGSHRALYIIPVPTRIRLFSHYLCALEFRRIQGTRDILFMFASWNDLRHSHPARTTFFAADFGTVMSKIAALGARLLASKFLFMSEIYWMTK